VIRHRADMAPPGPRARRLWGAIAEMRPDTAVKWSALSMGGSVGLVGVVIVLEAVVRWASELIPVAVSAVAWIAHLVGLLL
jgi:hypothetical protein